MNEDLKFAFSNVNDWLKFAEAKNAGLLALNLASIIGLLQSASSFTNIKALYGILITIFCISSLICVYTIIPLLNKLFRLYKKLDDSEFTAQKQRLNYLYFGDITKLSPEQYIELYKNKNASASISQIDYDLALQITNNAEISWQKYVIFRVACYGTFIGYTLGIITIIIACFTH